MAQAVDQIAQTMNGNMNDAEKLIQLEEKISHIETMIGTILENETKTAPVIEALSRLLIRRKTANTRAGIDPTTISKNDKIGKFEEVGHRRVFIELGDIAVIKKNRRRK